MSLAQSITDVVKKLDQIKKSVSAEKTAHKDDDDLKQQLEATKSEQAEKHVKDLKISDDNEKATKKVEKADDDGIDSDVEESVNAKAEKCDPEAPEEDKSKKSAKDDKDKAEKCGDEDIEESATKKSTDAKVEEAKAKQTKKLSNVEDPAGHEEASKSLDPQQALDALSKAVDTMAELQKSYIKLAESRLIEKSVKKDEAEKCGDGNEVDLSVKKDDKEEKCNNNADSVNNPDVDAKSAKKSVKDDKDEETTDTDDEEKCETPKADKAKKSVPASKAVSVASVEVEDAKDNADSAEKSAIKMGEFKDVLIKSMGDLNGAQLSDSIRQDKAIKSLYNEVRDMDDNAPVSDELIKKYNAI